MTGHTDEEYERRAGKLSDEALHEERIRIISEEAKRDALRMVGNRKRRRQLAAQLRRG